MQFPICIPALAERPWSAAPGYRHRAEMMEAESGGHDDLLLPKPLQGLHVYTHPQTAFWKVILQNRISCGELCAFLS